jgi:outer membrane lipoprotein-sorting protein
MEEAGARYRSVDSFCARFDQTLEIPLLNDTTRSRGTLCQRRPNLFSMRFQEPPGDRLVSDGKWFWVYYPSSDPRQVLQFDMDVRPGGVDFHREFLENPGEKYEMAYQGKDTLDGTVAHVISLDPLEPAGFEGARVWLDSRSSLILQARIGMENGSVRTVRLSEIRIDPPEDPDRFRFVPPEGARVIRRR